MGQNGSTPPPRLNIRDDDCDCDCDASGNVATPSKPDGKHLLPPTSYRHNFGNVANNLLAPDGKHLLPPDTKVTKLTRSGRPGVFSSLVDNFKVTPTVVPVEADRRVSADRYVNSLLVRRP